MRKKENNKLVLVTIGNGEKHRLYYYTSTSRAGRKLGIQACSVNWAIVHKNILYTCEGEPVTIEIIDGSEIPYKMINND